MPAFPAATVAGPASVTGFPLNPLGPGVILSGNPTVLIGPSALPAARVGSIVKPHGNPIDRRQPGFNPICSASVIATGSPTVLVGGLPMARITSMCSCGQHKVTFGVPTVLVGP